MIKRIVILTLIGLMMGCAHNQSKTTLTPDQIRDLWYKNQEKLSALNQWDIKGRAAISTATDGGSVSVFWNQGIDAYKLRIVAPFGRGNLLVEGNQQGAKLTDSKGEVLKAPTAEGLIWMRTGWGIPVELLKFWVVGEVKNKNNPTIDINTEGLTDYFESNGWGVKYLQYTEVERNGKLLKLPKKIELKSEHLKIKLKISRWTFI